MKKRLGKIIIALGALLLVICGAKYFLVSKIRTAAITGVEDLRREGYRIQYKSLTSGFWNSSISVTNLQVVFPGQNPVCPDTTVSLSADEISIEGIDILPLIFKHKVHLHNVLLKKPFVRYTRNKSPEKKLNHSKRKISEVVIDRFVMDSARYELFDSASCQLTTRAAFGFQATDMHVKEPGKVTMTWEVGEAIMEGLKIQYPRKFYTLTMRELTYNKSEKKIRMDSLRMLPDYDRTVFARKTGIQTDRVEGRFPAADITGVVIETSGDFTIRATQANLSFDLDVFRDKRYPFRNGTKSLPAHALHDLALKFHIDTLQILKSKITYDEVAEEGDKIGHVSFDDLTAIAGNVSNISTEDMTMSAETKFMNAGKLKADFTFPANPEKAYMAEGTLTGFNMRAINPMLIPAGNLEIKSGLLESLKFQFEYNDYRSDGTLTMDYTNLEMVSLHRNSKDKSTNRFATAILQAFVVKKDMDKNKSQGTVLFYRDTHRAIFNYWWKSVLSGIKSLYKLDKVTDTHHTKKK